MASFSEVSGLTADGDAIDYREGKDPTNNVRKLQGLRKYTPLMFKRGYVQDDTLWQWYRRIADGANERRNGSVILMNEAHRDVLGWNFVNAWINKIEGPSLTATGNQVADAGRSRRRSVLESAELAWRADTVLLPTTIVASKDRPPGPV